ncbi:MAG: sulfite exporter TauE/SafE family protein [Gammaproteobacteria bacterium]
MENFVYFLVLGSFAGLVAGLLGVGGGLIIVPVLSWLFSQQDIDGTVVVHLAVGTSLATIIFTSISSVRAHHQHGAVQWPIFINITPGIIVGALLGAAIARYMPTSVLSAFFGVFEILVAIQMAFAIKPKASHNLPSKRVIALVGIVIGSISAIVGIGGGTMTVPYLVWCNVAMRKAVATSAAVGLPIAIAGATGFVLAGWSHPGIPPDSWGFIVPEAFIGIVIASVLFAPLGARIAHRISSVYLKRIFAMFLFILGIKMLAL